MRKYGSWKWEVVSGKSEVRGPSVVSFYSQLTTYAFRLTFLSLLTTYAFRLTIYADILKTPGTAGAPFLKIGTSARAQSMGGLFTGLADDVSAIEYNPAGLVQLKKGEAAFSRIVWFQDITLDSVLLGYRIGKSAFGLGGTILKAVDYERTYVQISEQSAEVRQGEEILLQNISAVATYSVDFRTLNFGISVKHIGQNLYKTSNSSIAGDLGVLFKSANRRTGYGISVQNLGGAIGTDVLPACLRFGLGYREEGVNLTLESVQFIDSSAKYGAGLEIFFGKIFTLRGGLFYQQEFGYSLGVGFNFDAVNIDYAYLPHAYLGDAQRISLLIRFGKEGKPVTPARVKKVVVPQVTAPSVQPAQKISIAVVDFAGKGVSETDASIASDLFRTELVNIGVFRVLDKMNMEGILKEQEFQMTGCTSQECAVKAGKLLNAKRVVTGSYSKYADKYVITANMVDVETGEITNSFGQEMNSPQELPGACKILALKFSSMTP